jgi:hypothetical protein
MISLGNIPDHRSQGIIIFISNRPVIRTGPAVLDGHGGGSGIMIGNGRDCGSDVGVYWEADFPYAD